MDDQGRNSAFPTISSRLSKRTEVGELPLFPGPPGGRERGSDVRFEAPLTSSQAI